MIGTLLLYKPELPAAVRHDLTAQPALETLQTAVGGYIELVPFFTTTPGGTPCVAFCNEDGKRLRLAFNRAATDAWGVAHFRHAHCAPGDVLVGNVVVLTGDAAFMRALRDDEDMEPPDAEAQAADQR